MTIKMKTKEKVTKNEIVSLFILIRDAKNANLSREAMIKYVMLRVKMKDVFDAYERTRVEISEQTKPTDWNEGDSPEAWNEAFKPVMEEWLNETVDIDTHIFNEGECTDFIMSNPNKDGIFVDAVTEYFLMKE